MKRSLHPNSHSLLAKRHFSSTERSLEHARAQSPLYNLDAEPTVHVQPSPDRSSEFDQAFSLLPEGCSHEALICYGSILDISVQIREDPSTYAQHSRESDANSEFIKVRIFAKKDFYWLALDDGDGFACINGRTSPTLKRLMKSQCVEPECVVSKKRLHEVADQWRKVGRVAEFLVHINVYGHKHLAHSIGDMLACARLFLQDPVYDGRGLCYDNPQYLKLPNVSKADLTAHSVEGKQEDTTNDNRGISTAEIENLFDHIPQPSFLREEFSDSRIKTDLLRHQSLAVDFIIRRETNDLPPSLTLWKPHPEDGFFCFKHIITGAKSSEMEDAIGGILADDMGLGKTLSMLAAIVKTLPDALNFTLRTFSKSEKCWTDVIPCKCTLVIVPSALLLEGWTEEIRKHALGGTISVHRFHGAGKSIDLNQILQHDIILTTYASIAADFCRGHSPLHKIAWYRVVLDEAHFIRNPTTKQFRAINALPSKIRWCLTGTPIQNSLEDLGALMKFLRVPILDDLPIFRRYISTPIVSGTSGRFHNLRQLLQALCLRRTKTLLGLPEPESITQILKLSQTERAKYDDFGDMCQHTIELAVSGHSMKKANQHVIQAILGMRLFCNDGERALTKRMKSQDLPSDPQEALSYFQTSAEALCSQCGTEITTMCQVEDQTSGILTMCQHLICGECLPVYESDLDNAQVAGRSQCPTCGLEGDRDLFIIKPPTAIDPATPTSHAYSTKLLTLLENITSQGDDEKCIIFSFWKTTLDIVAQLFDEHSITYYRIHGQLSANRRSKILIDFERSNSHRIMLITLGTGAVGLNKLKVANHIHILEPQWNPSVESQAIGRVLRLGQEKTVKITRYIMKGTVEEAVQSRQLRKLQLARGGFGLTNAEDSSRRVEEIMNLLCPAKSSFPSQPA